MNGINSSKILNEFMMENGRNLKLQNKYLFAAFIIFFFQLVLGVNSAHAKLECYEEMLQKCKNDTSKIQCYESEDAMEKAEYSREEVLKADIAWYDENVEFYRKRDRQSNTVHTRFNLCYIKEQRRRWLAYSSSNQVSNSGASSNQSSSAGLSSKSNKNANRQSAENQSSSSSNSIDQSKKQLNEAIDQFNNADKQKDYAKAIPALKIILANTQDKQLKAAATNRLGEYYKFGDGVQKDEVKAQALFEQASMDGSTDADAQICHNYLNGIGVTENHQTAIKYCTSAANSGDLIPMAQLGWIYATGKGTQNTQLAKEWTCKAAKKGHAGSIKNAQILNFDCN